MADIKKITKFEKANNIDSNQLIYTNNTLRSLVQVYAVILCWPSQSRNLSNHLLDKAVLNDSFGAPIILQVM